MIAQHPLDDQLQRWLDGEAGVVTKSLTDHVNDCVACQVQIDGFKRARCELSAMVAGGVGKVDTLQAIAAIRTRIIEREERSWLEICGDFLRDLRLFHQRAFYAATLAICLGALSSPVIAYLLASGMLANAPQSSGAGVVIEDQTTMIWGDVGQTAVGEAKAADCNHADD
jgi:hypothetical protein